MPKDVEKVDAWLNDKGKTRKRALKAVTNRRLASSSSSAAEVGEEASELRDCSLSRSQIEFHKLLKKLMDTMSETRRDDNRKNDEILKEKGKGAHWKIQFDMLKPSANLPKGDREETLSTKQRIQALRSSSKGGSTISTPQAPVLQADLWDRLLG